MMLAGIDPTCCTTTALDKKTAAPAMGAASPMGAMAG
jgi:hypothetical protein